MGWRDSLSQRYSKVYWSYEEAVSALDSLEYPSFAEKMTIGSVERKKSTRVTIVKVFVSIWMARWRHEDILLYRCSQRSHVVATVINVGLSERERTPGRNFKARHASFVIIIQNSTYVLQNVFIYLLLMGYTFFATRKRRKDSDTLCRTESLAQIANSQRQR